MAEVLHLFYCQKMLRQVLIKAQEAYLSEDFSCFPFSTSFPLQKIIKQSFTLNIFFYCQMFFFYCYCLNAFLKLHKELKSHFRYCINYHINKLWHNEGTVLSINVTGTCEPHDDSQSLQLQKYTALVACSGLIQLPSHFHQAWLTTSKIVLGKLNTNPEEKRKNAENGQCRVFFHVVTAT